MEGAERVALLTMDWSIPIEVLFMERNPGSKDLQVMLAAKGYTHVGTNWGGISPATRLLGREDDIFVSKRIVTKLERAGYDVHGHVKQIMDDPLYWLLDNMRAKKARNMTIAEKEAYVQRSLSEPYTRAYRAANISGCT